jgi:hypothetical protein
MAPEQRRRLLEAHGGDLLLVVVRAATGDYRDGDGRAGGYFAPAAARSLLDELGQIRSQGRLWRWTADPSAVAEIVRQRARERWLIRHTQRIEAQLRAGERPSARLLRAVARRLEQIAVDSGT